MLMLSYCKENTICIYSDPFKTHPKMLKKCCGTDSGEVNP